MDYTYSKLKVIEKLNDYFEDIKDIHSKLNDKFPNLKNHSSSYYKYLKATFDEVESKIKELELNISDKTNNNIININNIIKNDLNENNTTNYDDTANKTKVQNDFNYLNNLNNNDTPYTPSEETIKDEANKNNDKEKSKKEERKNRDIPTSIRKYKKAVRRIIKLRLLYQEFKIKENIEIEEAKKDKNKNEENNNDNKDDKTKENNGSCLRDCFDLLGYIAFIMVIATDFLLPIFMKYQNESGKKEDNKKNSSILYLILSLFGILILGILFMPYTIISLISSIRRRYITGDYLYDEQINDHISLMKTVQIICGYSFTIIYCNLYFWKITDKAGLLGKPIFYEETIIPDYIIKNGFGIYMIVKLVIIITTIIFSFLFL
jgi:hypothetical protein